MSETPRIRPTARRIGVVRPVGPAGGSDGGDVGDERTDAVGSRSIGVRPFTRGILDHSFVGVLAGEQAVVPGGRRSAVDLRYLVLRPHVVQLRPRNGGGDRRATTAPSPTGSDASPSLEGASDPDPRVGEVLRASAPSAGPDRDRDSPAATGVSATDARQTGSATGPSPGVGLAPVRRVARGRPHRPSAGATSSPPSPVPTGDGPGATSVNTAADTGADRTGASTADRHEEPTHHPAMTTSTPTPTLDRPPTTLRPLAPLARPPGEPPRGTDRGSSGQSPSPTAPAERDGVSTDSRAPPAPRPGPVSRAPPADTSARRNEPGGSPVPADGPVELRVARRRSARDPDERSDAPASTGTAAGPTPIGTTPPASTNGEAATGADPSSDRHRPPSSAGSESGPDPASLLAAASRADVDRLVDRLYREFERKLRVERERRGL